MPTEKLIQSVLALRQKRETRVDSQYKREAQQFFDDLFHFLFLTAEKTNGDTESAQRDLQRLENIFEKLVSVLFAPDKVKELVQYFFNELNGAYESLIEDAQAICDGDPAASSPEEVIIAYPGFYAIAGYRISHLLWLKNTPLLPRIFTEYVHQTTGIDIHPGARIGRHFSIDHGTGIVIGETAEIGDNVKLYQGITLGALNVKKELHTTKRHPTVENNVVIYSGATILGGTTRIGRFSVIGGNVWLTKSVLPYSIVSHNSKVRIRDKKEITDIINFTI